MENEAHFLRYGGCKFHMRIPLAARIYMSIYVRSNAVTAAALELVRSNESLLARNIPEFKHLPHGRKGKIEKAREKEEKRKSSGRVPLGASVSDNGACSTAGFRNKNGEQKTNAALLLK